MKFKEMLRVETDNLPISMRHEKWLGENGSPKWSNEALEFANKVLSGKIGGNRKRLSRFRASSLGYCKRRQVYKALGRYEKKWVTSDLANIFATGNFLHLKWQMMGLTEGWLTSAEIPLESPDHDFGGTMDGIVYDGSLFEYKSINPRGFANVSEYGPRKDHVLQAHGYMWLGKMDAVSFIYEDKGSGEWKEFRVKRDEKIIESIIADLEKMRESARTGVLLDTLSECYSSKDSREFRNCPFSEACRFDVMNGDK